MGGFVPNFWEPGFHSMYLAGGNILIQQDEKVKNNMREEQIYSNGF